MEKRKITTIIFTIVFCATLIISLYSRVVATEPPPCVVGLPPRAHTEDYAPISEIVCQRCVRSGEDYIRTGPNGVQLVVTPMRLENYSVVGTACRVRENKACVARVSNPDYSAPACIDMVNPTGTSAN